MGSHAGRSPEVSIADTDAPVEYFNLQGVRVNEPAAGFYIRRQGRNVSKSYHN